MEDVKILEWIKNIYDNNFGYGHGNGSGAGKGSCSGVGSGAGDGYGYSDGSGFGHGSGYGYHHSGGYDFNNGCGYSIGYGSGYGDTYGPGYGDDYGHGHGYGRGVKSFDGKTIYLIDKVQTIISTIKGNLAKGFILNSDFSLSPCYICKGNGYFVHGETLKEAREALRGKILENMNTDETIEQFLSTFKKEKKYPAKDFYDWHHYLTGSCEIGRKSFLRDRNIDFDDMYTVDEFIALCENSYGGETIKELKERWNCRNGSD